MKGAVKHGTGFTLVEMLIAVALLSLLALGMVSVMRTMGQAQDGIDRRFQSAEQFQAVSSFLRDVLARISDRRQGSQPQGRSPFIFNGQSQFVEWIGEMPARHGTGGRHFFRLSIEPTGVGSALVLRYLPWRGEIEFPDWNQAQSRILIEDVVRFSLDFGGAEMPPAQWEPAWSSLESLPTRIRLDIATREGSWPLWIVATQALPPGGGRSSMFSAGPGL